MRLINGLVFGSGMGLLTIGAFGLGNEHTAAIVTLGSLLILIEAVRILAHARHQ